MKTDFFLTKIKGGGVVQVIPCFSLNVLATSILDQSKYKNLNFGQLIKSILQYSPINIRN